MKRILGIIAAIFFFSGGLLAQGFYLRLGLGYAMPQASQTMDGTGQPYNGTQNNSTYLTNYTLKGASFSAGLQGGLGVGYLFSEHVGVQLDASVGLATKTYSYNDENVTLGGVLSNVTVQQKANNPLMLIPSLVVQSGGDPWNIYCRMGVVLPLNTQITEDQIVTNAPGTGAIEVDDYTLKIKNSFSLGFAAAAGVEYKFSDRVSVWGEVSLLSMAAYIKESDLTNLTVNGQNYPLSAVSGPLNVKYSKSAAVDSSGAQQPTYSQPFSNFGINVGVRFNLSRNTGTHGHGRKNNDEDMDNNKPFRRR